MLSPSHVPFPRTAKFTTSTTPDASAHVSLAKHKSRTVSRRQSSPAPAARLPPDWCDSHLFATCTARKFHLDRSPKRTRPSYRGSQVNRAARNAFSPKTCDEGGRGCHCQFGILKFGLGLGWCLRACQPEVSSSTVARACRFQRYLPGLVS